LERKASKNKNNLYNPLHAESAKAMKTYEKAIEYNKRHHWRDWLEKASDPDIWTAHRYILAPTSDSSTARIPALRGKVNSEEVTASTNKAKSQMLARTFFLSKLSDEPQNPQEQGFLDPICKMDKIT
jgi:hypothetical protein